MPASPRRPIKPSQPQPQPQFVSLSLSVALVVAVARYLPVCVVLFSGETVLLLPVRPASLTMLSPLRMVPVV
ncbi:hypothetical protein D3C86_1743180 [compost metagenome]